MTYLDTYRVRARRMTSVTVSPRSAALASAMLPPLLGVELLATMDAELAAEVAA